MLRRDVLNTEEIIPHDIITMIIDSGADPGTEFRGATGRA